MTTNDLQFTITILTGFVLLLIAVHYKRKCFLLQHGWKKAETMLGAWQAPFNENLYASLGNAVYIQKGRNLEKLVLKHSAQTLLKERT